MKFALKAAGSGRLTPKCDGPLPKFNVKFNLRRYIKVARVMQPSVIYIDECEKVFLTDKKKLKVRRCRLTLSKPLLKAPMGSALEATIW
jgi:hypothetical protein